MQAEVGGKEDLGKPLSGETFSRARLVSTPTKVSLPPYVGSSLGAVSGSLVMKSTLMRSQRRFGISRGCRRPKGFSLGSFARRHATAAHVALHVLRTRAIVRCAPK